MSGIFITGTDTGVGKTLICGLLAGFLRRQGIRTLTQKWVQTGCGDISDDLKIHWRLAGYDEAEMLQMLPDLCPYCFPFPASPHLAAAKSGITIDPERIIAAYRKLVDNCEIVLVEGSGGALVPLRHDLLMIDLAARLKLTTVIVAANKLGCINHTLLTIEAVRKRNIPLLGVIFNRCQEGDEEILSDNPRIIAQMSGVPVLDELPHIAGTEDLAKLFEPIGLKLHW